MSVKEILQSSEFFSCLTPEQQQLMISSSREVTFAKGESVHRPDDKCLGVIYLQSGQLRTYMLSDDGREVTLYRLYKDDVCILSASCVLDAISFDVYVDAEEDTRAVIISAQVFQKIKSENVYLENFAYKLATVRFSDVMWAMQQILFMGADKRLAIFLNDESAKTGSDTLTLTHEQIARYMGSAREVVTRMLRYFQREGIVEVKRGQIKILDKRKLKDIISDKKSRHSDR